MMLDPSALGRTLDREEGRGNNERLLRRNHTDRRNSKVGDGVSDQ